MKRLTPTPSTLERYDLFPQPPSDSTSPHGIRRRRGCTSTSGTTALLDTIAGTLARIESVLTPSTTRQLTSWVEDWGGCPSARTPPIPVVQPARLADEALAALTDVQRWLRCSQAEAASLAGVAERTIPNWKTGRNPHPSSVRKVFALRGLLRALVTGLGRDESLAWLEDISPAGQRRMDVLRESDGVTRIIREARPFIFPAPPRSALLSDEPEEPDLEEIVGPRNTDRFEGQFTRARRIP